MNGKTIDGSRIVVEFASKLNLKLVGKRDGRGRSRDRDSKRDGSRRGPQQDDECFNCGNPGHW